MSRHRKRAKKIKERKQKFARRQKNPNAGMTQFTLDAETEEATKPFLIENTLIEEKMREWNLPTIDNPRKDGVVLYYAEAQNNSGYPHIVIRAIRGEKIPDKGFHKAQIRGFAVWRPSFIRDEWEVAIKRKSGSGNFEKFSAPNHEEALEKLIQKLKKE